MRFETTPNPDALKCLVAPTGPAPAGALRSYRAPEQAQGDDLARRLFEIEGVAGVLITPAFVTVNRVPGAPWAPIKAGLRRVLADGR